MPRAAQVNELPQSGSAVFISLFAHEEKNIGTKARRTSNGVWTPTITTTNPSVAAIE